MLKPYRAWQNQEKLKLGQNWLLTTFDGDPIHLDSISWWFVKFVREYDLPSMSIHSLRHTNITLMIMAGVPLRTVAKRSGHSSTVTTSLIYFHAIQSADEAASKVLGMF
jgi:integrase